MEEKAYFAAGCFWGVEKRFSIIKGITNTTVGYSGGNSYDATYKNVCSGKTNHAETIEIKFNPEIISYDQLLNIFWNCHNPTQLNRQGPDIGKQYRSEIFYTDKKQQNIANISMKKLHLSKKHPKSIVTKISQFDKFYMAENYHQQYLKKNGLFNCGD